MEQHALIVSFLILVINYTTSSDVQSPDANLQEHVKKLDEMLAELQSHSQAQEQKYSAVLSSLLSQLTQTTEDLGDLKTSHNETLLTSNKRDAEFSELWASHNETVRKLEEKDTELSELWASHNETTRKLEEKDAELSKLWESYNATIINLEEKDAKCSEFSLRYNETVIRLESTLMKCNGNNELSQLRANQNETVSKLETISLKLKEKDAELNKLWASHNATVSEFENFRTQHNSVEVHLGSKLENFEKHLNQNGYIGFQGRLSESKNVSADSPLFFYDISYNEGVGYDKNTGRFTIPTSGTYQIWVVFSYKRPKEPFVFMIYRNGYALDQAYGGRSDTHETTATTTLAYLRQGDYIWVAPTVNVSMDHYFCKFGIVLLNAH